MGPSGKSRGRRDLEQNPAGRGHNPFSQLLKGASNAPPPADGREGEPAGEPSEPTEARSTPCPELPRRERKGRGGKGVIVVSGLPEAERGHLVRAAKRALGTGARLEGEDLVIQGDQGERVSKWLTGLGFPTRRAN